MITKIDSLKFRPCPTLIVFGMYRWFGKASTIYSMSFLRTDNPQNGIEIFLKPKNVLTLKYE